MPKLHAISANPAHLNHLARCAPASPLACARNNPAEGQKPATRGSNAEARRRAAAAAAALGLLSSFFLSFFPSSSRPLSRVAPPLLSLLVSRSFRPSLNVTPTSAPPLAPDDDDSTTRLGCASVCVRVSSPPEHCVYELGSPLASFFFRCPRKNVIYRVGLVYWGGFDSVLGQGQTGSIFMESEW